MRKTPLFRCSDDMVFESYWRLYIAITLHYKTYRNYMNM